MQPDKLLPIFLLLLLVSSTLQWNQAGHMIVSNLAKRDIINNNPAAYTWAKDLLSELISLTNETSSDKAFVECSSFPDALL
jgi:hypothetical protein